MAQAIAKRLAERLRLSGIDERADLRAAVESDSEALPQGAADRAVCGTSHLSETDCSE